MQDWTMRDQTTGVENAGPENGILENAGPYMIWKRKDHDVSGDGRKMSRHQERFLKAES